MMLLDVVKCGDIKIPMQIASILHAVISLIKFGVPILLIIFGMLDLGKAVMAQKEDEIKKGQQTFVKRLISAAIVFFVVSIVQFAVSFIDASTDTNWDCINAIISGDYEKYKVSE